MLILPFTYSEFDPDQSLFLNIYKTFLEEWIFWQDFTVFSDLLYIKLSADHSFLLIKLSWYALTLKTKCFWLITQYMCMKTRQEIIWMHFMPFVFWRCDKLLLNCTRFDNNCAFISVQYSITSIHQFLTIMLSIWTLLQFSNCMYQMQKLCW